MNMLIIQSLILVALAFLAGCIFGSLFRRLFGSTEQVNVAPAGIAGSQVIKPEKQTVSVVSEDSAVKNKEPKEPDAAPLKSEEMETPVESEDVPEQEAQEDPKEEPDSEAEKTSPQKAAKTGKSSKLKTKDDLTRIKGIGPVIEDKLNKIGVESYSQIASWRKLDRDAFSEKLSFKGRIERDSWVPQARVLADGRETEYSRKLDRRKAATAKPGTKQVKNTGKPRIYRKEPASGKDKLTQLNGVGNALEQKLVDIGVYKIRQIAGWNEANQTWIGNEIGFPGRVQREKWVDQAKKLSGMDTKKPKARRARKTQKPKNTPKNSK